MASWTSGYVADLPYLYSFHAPLAPSRLSLVALTRSVQAPQPDQPLAYCELGCGQGYSSNLLAAANPQIEFYSTDFNPAHIIEARVLAEECGTTNVHFFEQSFAEFLEYKQLPEFDMIALNGIYSWVSPESRAIIVEFIRRRLKPGGLVYITYNALPGWASAMPLQRLLQLYGAVQGGPSLSRMEAALAFLKRLQSADAKYFRDPMTKARTAQIYKSQPRYLAHEYINDNWTSFYHYEVARDLANAKLSYLAASDILADVIEMNLSAEQQKVVAELSDPSLQETVRDYIVNTPYRRDVFIRGAVSLSPDEVRGRWRRMRFALALRAEDVSLKVKGELGDAELPAETYRPVVESFGDGPRTVEQILEDKEVARIGWDQLVQGLIVLAGAGHLHPCLDEQGDEARRERTGIFNEAVKRRAVHSDRLHALASPKTGGGVEVDRISQLFILAHEQQQSDPVQAVGEVLRARGHRILKDGKPLASAEENLAELRAHYDRFVNQQQPVLRQLGIC